MRCFAWYTHCFVTSWGGVTVPLYEYECVKCDRRTEKIENVNGPHLKKCPDCGGRVERMLTAPAIQFKGSGWYVTDYAGKKGSSAESGAEAGSGNSEKSESKDSGKDSGKENAKESAKESSSKETSSKESKESKSEKKKK